MDTREEDERNCSDGWADTEDKLNSQHEPTLEMSNTQLAITLAKLYIGSRPGDELWCEYDYEALEYALGHPVDRR